MSKQTKRRRNKTNRRRNKTNRRRHKTNRRRHKTNLREFIPRNKGKGYEQQKPFKIIVDNNNHKQFGNIIPGLREM